MHSKNGGDGGTGVYMREGTTSRVTAADRPYGEFYGFYSISPENFGSTHVVTTGSIIIVIYDANAAAAADSDTQFRSC